MSTPKDLQELECKVSDFLKDERSPTRSWYINRLWQDVLRSYCEELRISPRKLLPDYFDSETQLDAKTQKLFDQLRELLK